MATEYEKTKAYKRGITGQSGARSPWSLSYADKQEKKEYEKGRRDRILINEKKK